MRISDWSSDVCSSDLPAPEFLNLVSTSGEPAGIEALPPCMTSCLPTPEDGRGVDFLQVSPTPPVLFRFPLLPTAPDLPCRVFLERRLSRETGAVIMTAGISVQFDFSEDRKRTR